jgi:hypothetical protein
VRFDSAPLRVYDRAVALRKEQPVRPEREKPREEPERPMTREDFFSFLRRIKKSPPPAHTSRTDGN